MFHVDHRRSRHLCPCCPLAQERGGAAKGRTTRLLACMLAFSRGHLFLLVATLCTPPPCNQPLIERVALGGAMEQCVRALELLGMLVYAGAWLCVLGATVSPWLSMSTELLQVERYELGLWETCVVQDVGGMECRPYDSLLGLSRDLKLARVLTCTSLATGVLGFLVAIPGLSLVNSCEEDGGTKRILTIIAAILGILSGVLCLIPVSYVAHQAVVRFFDDTVPDVVPRWEFGDALFCGWAGGFLLVVAGLVLLISSCWSSQAEPPRPALQRRNRGMNPMLARSEYV
uniref:putative claudin-24 n=1 Tax=Doryrhamphus excisus TaxID=161450 RepID=UPI0025ADDF23|nr:putative claudin-24 [Doryrhamphus excisus]XP_057929655.1 putative claudin-24 [Doryrhamphus excisus]XP_057929656.1 putative claudin-24 [Doryrhamphus excisus]